MRRRCLCLSLFLAAGCLRVVRPMPAAFDHFTADAPAKCLIIFLPGVADRAQTFTEQGFVQALRKRRLSVDTVAADDTLGYYVRGVSSTALEADVVRKALAHPYAQVWMVGVSLGGFGALHYASRFPWRLDGVLALAPHQGEETSLQLIRDAGGLAAWQPELPADTFTDEAYAYFRGTLTQHRSGPELWLGYGASDFVTGQPLLLANAMPKAHVLRDAGGHSWSTWGRLWEQFLDASELKARCAPAAVATKRMSTPMP